MLLVPGGGRGEPRIFSNRLELSKNFKIKNKTLNILVAITSYKN
jgi:hypothetical protein